MSALAPPAPRSRATLGLTAAAAAGRFELQVCDRCQTLQYPPRETCVNCLSDQLTWREHSGRGELIAATTIHHTNDAYFRERVPWNIGAVRLEGNVTVIAHLHHACMSARGEVRVRALLDRGGRGVLFAFPTDAARAAEPDPQVLDMTCSPKQKRILVTDGSSELGQALVTSLLAAGADVVWSGIPDHAQPPAPADPNALRLPLDVTDAASVEAAADRLASQVEIVINNAEFHGDPTDVSHADRVELAHAEMNTNYLGLVRLATAFTPHLLARAHERSSRPTAWVNVLSIYALSSLPSQGSCSASKAAALSFAQSLRAQVRASGIRVINVFPGPLETAAFREVPQPRLSSRALARAIVEALESGQDDCYPGDVAQDFQRRWRQDPKVLELELQS